MTFTRTDIVERIKAMPFRPFRLRLRDGRVLNVGESNDLWAGLSGWLVYDSGRNDLAFSDVQSVIAVEERRASKSSRR